MDPEDESTQMHLLGDDISTTLNHTQLLDNLCSKDFRSFQSLVDQTAKRQSTSTDLTYLDVACKDGLTKFVKILLERGAANVNRINNTYNRGPIHFATENGHTEVVRVLLDEPTINPNLEAGQQTALHMAVKRNDLNVAELLLEKGASPNIPNNKGLTALHMAAIKSQRDMVELILRKSQHALCLDNYKDYNDQTTRDVLQEKLPDVSLPPVQKMGVNVHDLKYYLNVNDEMNFLKCMEIVQDDVVVNNVLEDLIEMAVQRNFQNTVRALLERIQGTASGIGRNLEKAANIAIQRGSPDILRQILNANVEVETSKLLLNACLELGIPRKENSRIVSDRLECLKLILQRDDAHVGYTDGKGNTPLHYAARADCREAVTLLLEKGSYIGRANNLGVPPVAHIFEPTLSRYFDKCIETRKDRPNEYTIEFDYKCFVQDQNFIEQKREMDVFQYIADNNGLRHLLKHPLLSLFLYLKWRRIRCILYLNFAFYFVLCVLLNVYIVFATYKKIDAKASTNSSEQVINDDDDNEEAVIESTSLNFLRIFTGLGLMFLVLKEILQLISSPCYYLSNFDNWPKIILVLFGFWMLCGAGVQVAVVVILLSAWELVIVIGQHPWMSTDIEIFKKVFVNFMRFLFLYAFLILAFALAFFALFKNGKNDDYFPDPGHSLFRTIIMLTGEFDANDIPFVSHPILGRLVFVLFVFLIVIVLFNLLNGLAVSNTADILGKAELVGLITRTRLIAYVENVVIQTHCLLQNFLRSDQGNPLDFLIRKILLFPRRSEVGDLSPKLIFPYDTLRDAFIRKTTDERWLHENFKDKVFLDLMKQVNEIVSKRDKESDTERIIGETRRINERLAFIEISLNALKRGIENNNLNVRKDDGH